MSDDHLPSLLQRAFRACLLICGCALLLWLAVHWLTEIWGWLLGAAILALLVSAVALYLRHRRDRW